MNQYDLEEIRAAIWSARMLTLYAALLVSFLVG